MYVNIYLPSWLGQETAKKPFGLQVKLPPTHLPTTHGEGFAMSSLMLNNKQKTVTPTFIAFGLFNRPGTELESTVSAAGALLNFLSSSNAIIFYRALPTQSYSE